MTKGLFIDASTGETVERELSADEIAAMTRPEEEVAAERNAEAQAARRGAFQAEADPLYFAWQRGEGTEQAWLDKCAEIRQRYPYMS
jgi:hypothetical protein